METNNSLWHNVPWLILLVAPLVVYAVKSVFVIKASEIGVLIRFGKVVKVVHVGFHFSPWIFHSTSLLRYPREPMVVRVKVKSAITGNGIVKGYKENGKEVEKTEMDISVTLTTYFSENLNDLKKSVARISEANINNFGQILSDYVSGVVREVISEMPWPLFNSSWNNLSKYLLARIVPNSEYFDLIIEDKDDSSKPNKYSFSTTKSFGDDAATMEANNPFVQLGLDVSRTSLIIQNIDFSNEEMKKIFNSPEISRIKGDADVVEAETEAKKSVALAVKTVNDSEAAATKRINEGKAEAEVIKSVGIANAEARALMISKIKDNPDLEYLRVLEEMTKGTSNTIIYQMPKAFENRVSNILGGNNPDDLFSFLKDPEIVKTVKEAIEKLTKKED